MSPAARPLSQPGPQDAGIPAAAVARAVMGARAAGRVLAAAGVLADALGDGPAGPVITIWDSACPCLLALPPTAIWC